jgi:hypothetical protein
MPEKVSTIKHADLKINWGKLGMSLSLLCAIHCLAMPFVITLLPLAGGVFNLDATTEIILIGASVIISSLTLSRDYLKHHHSLQPLYVLTLGVLLIAVMHLIPLPPAYKWTESLGGIMLFAAFLVNRKHMKKHHTCVIHK